MVLATQHWGLDWEGLADSAKIAFEGEGADVCLLGWVGNEGMLELGNMPEEDTEKATSKKVGR